MTGKKRQPKGNNRSSSGPAKSSGGSGSSGASATSRKQSAAQARLSAQRAMAAASGARAKRRARLLKTVVAPIVAVIVIVGVIVAVGVTRSSSSSKSSASHTPVAASASLQSAVTGVSSAVFDQVGIGSGVQAPTANAGGAALTSGGKPEILYVGAEWCPYCAAERWALAAAVARFGTLSGLQTTYSSSDDVNKNTPTLTFAKAKYTSQYIDLSANEIQDQNHKTLATLSSADNTLFTSLGQGAFPFIDIGGKYYISGASFDGSVLAGKTHQQIASAMSDPNSKIALAVDGSANYISAALCSATNQQPTAVCSSSGVKAAAAKLGIKATTSGSS